MKKIFISGASSGIGRAMAVLLIEQGHEVWGTSRSTTRLTSLSKLHPIELDLAERDSIERGFKRALTEAGHFDVVINNAGSGHFGPAENLSGETIAGQFQVLVFGQLQLMQLALPNMRDHGHGLIINVTSLAARLPVPFMAAYNSAKAALSAYIMSMQLELPDAKIRIVDLAPADICTEFNDDIAPDEQDPRYAARVAKTWGAVERNMKAAPKPELVARRVLSLIEQTNPPPRLTVGGAFQAAVAPLIFRFLPQRVRLWGLKMYYGI